MFEFSLNELSTLITTFLLIVLLHTIFISFKKKIIDDFNTLKGIRIIDKNNNFKSNDLLNRKIANYTSIYRTLKTCIFVLVFFTIIIIIVLSVFNVNMYYSYYILILAYLIILFYNILCVIKDFI